LLKVIALKPISIRWSIPRPVVHISFIVPPLLVCTETITSFFYIDAFVVAFLRERGLFVAFAVADEHVEVLPVLFLEHDNGLLLLLVVRLEPLI
jgi:hypothetical protein